MTYGKYRWTIKKIDIKIKYTDTAGDLYAVEVSVSLLEYLKGESHNSTGASAAVSQTAETAVDTAGTESAGTSYTVKSGDCMWNIALSFYGDGAQYMKIYEANRDVIGGNPARIFPGQVLTIPA